MMRLLECVSQVKTSIESIDLHLFLTCRNSMCGNCFWKPPGQILTSGFVAVFLSQSHTMSAYVRYVLLPSDMNMIGFPMVSRYPNKTLAVCVCFLTCLHADWFTKKESLIYLSMVEGYEASGPRWTGSRESRREGPLEKTSWSFLKIWRDFVKHLGGNLQETIDFPMKYGMFL